MTAFAKRARRSGMLLRRAQVDRMGRDDASVGAWPRFPATRLVGGRPARGNAVATTVHTGRQVARRRLLARRSAGLRWASVYLGLVVQPAGQCRGGRYNRQQDAGLE